MDFQWTRMILVEFLVALAWPVVAIIALRTIVHNFKGPIANLISRVKVMETKFGKIEVHDIPQPLNILPLPRMDIHQSSHIKDMSHRDPTK